MASQKFQRKQNPRFLKKIIHFAVEGEVTEVQYLGNLQNIYTNFVFRTISCTDNSPKKILDSMKKFEKSYNFNNKDYLLIMIDRDRWSEDAIEEVWNWKRKKNYRIFIISNPCFELWLLRHYTQGGGASTCQICRTLLKRYNPSLADKKIPINTFSREDCLRACVFSHNAGVKNWRTSGYTNGYELIELLEKDSA